MLLGLTHLFGVEHGVAVIAALGEGFHCLLGGFLVLRVDCLVHRGGRVAHLGAECEPLRRFGGLLGLGDAPMLPWAITASVAVSPAVSLAFWANRLRFRFSRALISGTCFINSGSDADALSQPRRGAFAGEAIALRASAKAALAAS